MNKILTIIIPSYNMEKYLSYCVESLLIPSINDIEILIINDGSTDKTSDIAHAYQKQYPQSITVVDKENGNYGSCINNGLKIAKGKYIKILDADDSFDSSNFESYIKYLKNIDADLILSSFALVNEKREIRKQRLVRNNANVESFNSELLKYILDFNLQMHAVTYKKEIFDRLNYQQTEGISYTDTEWIFTPISKISTISFFHKTIYLYLMGRDGQSMSFSNPVKSASDMFRMTKSLIYSYNQINSDVDTLHKEYLDVMLKRWIRSYYNIFIVKNRSPKIDKIVYDFDLELKNNAQFLYKYLDYLNLHRLIPFKYIRHWRKMNGKNKQSLILKLIGKLI